MFSIKFDSLKSISSQISIEKNAADHKCISFVVCKVLKRLQVVARHETVKLELCQLFHLQQYASEVVHIYHGYGSCPNSGNLRISRSKILLIIFKTF